jgi:hypothetical protein
VEQTSEATPETIVPPTRRFKAPALSNKVAKTTVPLPTLAPKHDPLKEGALVMPRPAKVPEYLLSGNSAEI